MALGIKNFKLILPAFFLFATACASGPSHGDGLVALTLKTSHEAAALSENPTVPDLLKIDTFRVVISGDDFSPLETFFPGDTREGTISGIPSGENRSILIEAINKNGRLLRRGGVTGVRIAPKDRTSVTATLFVIPFVWSPSDGNYVTQTRLSFRGYAEPGGNLTIQDQMNDSSSLPLLDLNTSSESISPSLSDGGFFFQPPLLPLGTHTFTFQDSVSGEQSQITVTLGRPGRMPGIGVTSAGAHTSNQIMTLGGLSSEVVSEMAQ